MRPAGVCSVCFREFFLDPQGRLYGHIRVLGKQPRCPGYRFPHAGESLDGTRWAIDQMVSEMTRLDHHMVWLQSRPILDGMSPFDPQYDARWFQLCFQTEHDRGQTQRELTDLAAKLQEWTPAGPVLEPRPVHKQAIWKCRAGTAVPLCYSDAARRPTGSPIMVDEPTLVECVRCISMFSG